MLFSSDSDSSQASIASPRLSKHRKSSGEQKTSPLAAATSDVDHPTGKSCSSSADHQIAAPSKSNSSFTVDSGGSSKTHKLLGKEATSRGEDAMSDSRHEQKHLTDSPIAKKMKIRNTEPVENSDLIMDSPNIMNNLPSTVTKMGKTQVEENVSDLVADSPLVRNSPVQYDASLGFSICNTQETERFETQQNSHKTLGRIYKMKKSVGIEPAVRKIQDQANNLQEKGHDSVAKSPGIEESVVAKGHTTEPESPKENSIIVISSGSASKGSSEESTSLLAGPKR